MQIGPSSRLHSTFPTTTHSSNSRIDMHNQVCLLLDGSLVFRNLKLYLHPKTGKQCGKSVESYKRHFIKEGRVWRQYK